MTEESLFTLQNLYHAYCACREGKRKTHNMLAFEMDRERNLVALLHELRSRTYRISRHICFVIKKPSPREIFAADFRDRVVHHLLYRAISPSIDARLLPHSYANRPGKGTHAAVHTLEGHIRAVKRATGGGYYLKLDIQSFFRSINRHILYTLVERHIAEDAGGGQTSGLHDEISWLAEKIIFHDPTRNFAWKGDPSNRALIPPHKSLFSANGVGLPIGNLTSQFFANVYLHELDRFIVHELGCARYVRYVDDMVLIDADKEKLRSFVPRIETFLREQLRLRLHPDKTRLQKTSRGVDFLGYFIKPSHTLVRQKVVRRLKARLYAAETSASASSARDVARALLPALNSYWGHCGHANSVRLRRHLFEKHMPALRGYLTTDDECRSFTSRKSSRSPGPSKT